MQHKLIYGSFSGFGYFRCCTVLDKHNNKQVALQAHYLSTGGISSSGQLMRVKVARIATSCDAEACKSSFSI
jgi:hypothetical protein